MKKLFAANKRPFDFDLIILGTSVEGLACAKEVSQMGFDVAVVGELSETLTFMQERSFLDLLYHSGKYRTTLEEAVNYSWNFNHALLKPVSLQRLHEAKKHTRESCLDSFMGFIHKGEVAYLSGSFKLVSSHPITISNLEDEEDIYTTEFMVISPLATYQYPDFNGSNHGLLPKDLMTLDSIHGNILIYGGESEAVELASAFIQMGLDTTLMTRNGVSSYFDSQMMSIYFKTLVDKGLKVNLKTIVKLIEKLENGKINVHFTALSKSWKGSQQYDFIVFLERAIESLRPLQLQNINLKTTSKEIPTNEKFQTNIKNIFATGYVLKHRTYSSATDIQIAKNLATYLFKDKNQCLVSITDKVGTLRGPVVDYAFVGLTENAANETYGADNVEVYHSFYKPTEFGVAKKPFKECYIKIICLTEKDELIVGMHITGPYAATIMQGYAAAMKYAALVRFDGDCLIKCENVKINKDIYRLNAFLDTKMWPHLWKSSQVNRNISNSCSRVHVALHYKEIWH